MLWGAVIIVEGKTDERFIACCLNALGYACVRDDDAEQKENIKPENTALIYSAGGIDGNPLFGDRKTAILRNYLRRTNTALFILDANGDAAEKKRQFAAWAAAQLTKKPAILELFLMPDNKGSGSLETLLKTISVNKSVYDCIDALRRCLTDKGYQETPDAKGALYAYCEANGIDARSIDYSDTNHWNINAAEMQPLENFLKQRLPPLLCQPAPAK